MELNVNKKILNAVKWSSLTEIMSKLITPFTSVILAHLLVPESFGIVASSNIVISFCDLFTDAGFHKYIIQHKNKEGIEPYINVAFWTNLILSLFVLCIIVLFAETIAILVGCPNNKMVIIVSCINLPLNAFISIQTAILKRNMDFRTLFYVRIVTIICPIIITIPLAFILRSYWSMILGTIVNNVCMVIATFVLLRWKPIFNYNVSLLKEMLKFSLWSLLESIIVWLINWGDFIIVSNILSQYYLGLYKTSMSLVNQIVGIISSALTPVLLSALSNYQDDDNAFKDTFYLFCFLSGIALLPMSVLFLVYKDTICLVSLGSNWIESSSFIGIWGFISAIAIIFNSYCGLVLISKGKSKISVIVQIIQIAFIIPSVYISAQKSFILLSYSRALVRIIGMIVYGVAVYKTANINMFKIINRLVPAIIGSIVITLVGHYLHSLHIGILFDVISALFCLLIYTVILIIFPNTRKVIFIFVRNLFTRYTI